VQSGHDTRAPLAIAGHERFAGRLDEFTMAGQRIGWLGDLGGYLAMEAGILDVCERGLRQVEALGAAVEPVRLGFAPERVWQAWLVWRRWLVAARMAPYLEDPANRARIKPEALWEHDQAQGLSGTEVLAASTERTAFYAHLLTLFERFDFLALPSSQVWPFDAGLHWPTRIGDRDMDTYHRWMEVVIYATLAGLPCISMPVGFGAHGLPMGLQLIGKPHGDLAVLQLAHHCERWTR
jgi:amidase